MIGIKEKSLSRALDYCHLPALPEKDDDTNVWIRAIALVKKTDMSHSYVYVERNTEDLSVKVMFDFGRPAQIYKFEEFYPFSYLDAAYVPEFKTQKKEERLSYLHTYKPEKDFSKLTLKELDKEVLKISIEKQIKFEKGLLNG